MGEMLTSFFENSTNWVILSSLIFLWIIFKFAKTPILKGLDSRIEEIQNELDTAENLRIEAQEMLAQYQRKHRDSMQEAEQILAEAKDHAKKIKEQAEADFQNVQARREKQLKERLDRIEEQAIKDIKSYAVSLSVQAAEDVVKSKMDKKTDSALIDSTIKNVKSYAKAS